MKQILLSAAFLLFTGIAIAQVPQKFNYQGIARDTKGTPMAKKQLSLKLTVLPTSDATAAEYEETQLVTTNEFGLYTLQIGNGTPVTGEMKTVKWETGNKYIKVAIDATGGTNYVDAGTTQLLSVPYAIYADKAGIAKEIVGGEGHTRTGSVSSNATHVVNDANYITKFTSLNTIGKSLFYDNGSGVGLGVTSPVGLFHTKVNSGNNVTTLENTSASGTTRTNFQADGALNYCTIMKRGSGIAGSFGVSTIPFANMFSFGNNTGPMVLNSQGNMGIACTITGVIQYKFLTDTLSGNVGIAGNAIPSARAHVNNTQSTSANLRITNNTTGHTANDGLEFSTVGNTASITNRENSTLSFGTNNLERVRVDAVGNVGIGTITPGAKLEVSGQVKITGGTPGAGKVLTSDATGLAAWQTPTGGGGSLSGTTNYVTKFTSPTTGGNSQLFDNGTRVGIGTITPASKFHVTDATTTYVNGIIRGEYTGPAVSVDVVGVYGKSLLNSLYGIGVQGEGNWRGIKGTSTTGVGAEGISSSGTGVFGSSLTGIALYGNAGKSNGLYATSDSMSAGRFVSFASGSPALFNGVLAAEYNGTDNLDYVAISGSANVQSYGVGVKGKGGYIGAMGEGESYGLFGVNTGLTGTGVYGDGGVVGTGVSGFSANADAIIGYSTGGNGVYAYSANGIGINASSNSNSAGYFSSGNSSLSSTLNTNGVVYGEYTGSNVQDAIGVVGKSTPPSTYGIGVKGIGNWIGVYGTDNASGNYAGFFDGNLFATTASSSIKAFKIDHPTDPANKYLYHSSVESNDMMDIYNGNITTDASGDAVVSLPSYFQALNIDYKYQLTVIGTFAQAIISEEVANNQFKIKTNQPGVKVSWQVTGVRNDAMAQAHRIQTEVEKTGREKGKYLNPLEAGMSFEDGIIERNVPTTTTTTSNAKHNQEFQKQHNDMKARIEKTKIAPAPAVAKPSERK